MICSPGICCLWAHPPMCPCLSLTSLMSLRPSPVVLIRKPLLSRILPLPLSLHAFQNRSDFLSFPSLQQADRRADLGEPRKPGMRQRR